MEPAGNVTDATTPIRHLSNIGFMLRLSFKNCSLAKARTARPGLLSIAFVRAHSSSPATGMLGQQPAAVEDSIEQVDFAYLQNLEPNITLNGSAAKGQEYA
jgi:hypothetical protein